ncbi:MAG TPA: FHA domain-containing protein [Miltoncostaeaceae bacterium]|nr:FHA domain-containing protein [Miltoncostaeaceae bacterium]
MTETGLIIAEVAFLVLLYLFIWTVVRSSTRSIREPAPPPAPRAEPRPREDTSPHPVVRAEAPAGSPRVTASPPPVAVPADGRAGAIDGVATQRERAPAPELDFSANLHPRLVVERSPSLTSGTEVELKRGLTIGRSRSNGIPVSDAFVSHMHARVFPHGQFFYIEDLGSTNGTYLNGRLIAGQTQLKMRDVIRLGETVLRYEE